MSDMQMIAWCETTRSGAALTACVIENEDLWLTIKHRRERPLPLAAE